MSSIQKKVFVAMSGGVDSSVAALLLKEQGYDCTGVFMKCYNLDGCAERDAEDARRVANHIGIPFYTFDFEKEYKKKVVDYMLRGYKRGITPNPDVMCNREIKFGLFLKKALSLGAEYVATGHYVRIGSRVQGVGYREKDSRTLNPKPYTLWSARDAGKDQSYFLWTLTQKELAHCLFPIGDYLKPEVRNIARKAGLPTAEKKDSQGICFLGDIDVFEFLAKHIKEKRGDIVLARHNLGDGGTTYQKVGEHRGIWFYTIGQRHLGISNIKYPASAVLGTGGQKSKSGEEHKPYYVAAKDVKTNTLTVAEGSESPALFQKEVTLADVSFVSPETISLIRTNKGYRGFQVMARVRYRQPLSPATLTFSNSRELENNGTVKLIFDKPQKFVAAGQSAVFYVPAGASTKAGREGLEMLGGGVIE